MSFISSAGAVSRWRDVYLAAGARGVSQAGSYLSATALLLALQDRGAGGWAVAALLTAATAPLVLLAPLTGRLVDRVDSRSLLTGVALAQAACCLAMVLAPSPVALIALSALVASGIAVTQPAFAALVPDMVTREDLPRATAVGQTAASIGMLSGPALAGLLYGTFGLRLPLLLDAASYLAVAAAGLLIATRRGRAPVAGSARGADGAAAVPAPAGWRIARDGLLFPMVSMVGLVVAVVSMINVAEVFFVRETLHASATMYGALGACWMGTMLVGSWLVARRGLDDAGYALLMAGLLAAVCVVVAIGGQVPHVGWLVPLWLLGGVGNGGINSVCAVLIARRAPAAVRGRAFATLGAVASGANLAGYAVGGALVGLVAPGALLTAAGVAGVLAVAVCAPRMLRAARRDRAGADPAGELPHPVPEPVGA